ncbi:MAG: iron-only hydrogenase system regulator [Kiritimatiellae bacterium]|nr:iron-only hydrogenase system regulator [Kiritimatiellia bacterium]
MTKRLGFVGIIIQDRERTSEQVNRILSAHGTMIVARLGVPYREAACCVITLVVHASTDEVGRLTGRLGMLEGVCVRSALAKWTRQPAQTGNNTTGEEAIE